MSDPVIYDYDGFEDYATAGILREHVRLLGTPTIETGGRNGGDWLKCPQGSAVVRAIPGSPFAGVTIGTFCRFDGLPSSAGAFLDFRDPTGSQVILVLNGDGSISAAKGQAPTLDFGNYPHDATVLGTSAPGVVVDGIGLFLIASVLISATVGTVTVLVNNVPVLTLTGLNTQTSTTLTVTNLLMGSEDTYGPTAVWIDDLYLADQTLGDRRVGSTFATAQGTHSDGTPLVSGDHFAMVNEAPEPDDVASYVTLDTADQRESYLFEDFALGDGETVDAVMGVIDGRKTAEGPAELGATFRIGGVDYDGSDLAFAAVATGLWPRRKTLSQVSPATAVAWDPATELNPPEAGVLKIA